MGGKRGKRKHHWDNLKSNQRYQDGKDKRSEKENTQPRYRGKGGKNTIGGNEKLGGQGGTPPP